MTAIDWIVLAGTLATITGYGVWRSRGARDVNTYVLGDGTLRWRLEQGFEMKRPSILDIEADVPAPARVVNPQHRRDPYLGAEQLPGTGGERVDVALLVAPGRLVRRPRQQHPRRRQSQRAQVCRGQQGASDPPDQRPLAYRGGNGWGDHRVGHTSSAGSMSGQS